MVQQKPADFPFWELISWVKASDKSWDDSGENNDSDERCEYWEAVNFFFVFFSFFFVIALDSVVSKLLGVSGEIFCLQ